ncbi:MAG TPA: MEDS domain-containing protein [Verrucomicrobiae bacterium]|nr:MEDS domain-containing protein [Verrucomicrobiae bacterium]
MNQREQLGMGDHVAYFFRSNAERLAFVIPYIAAGLRRNERCLYIADNNSAPAIYRELDRAGVDTDGAHKRGALSVLTKREAYLRHGVFEPEKMVSDLNNEVKHSLEHGFTGLRASGEMSWALDLPSALARLIEYEERLQATWPAEFEGVCQYDEARFSKELIERMKQIHQVYVCEGRIIRQGATPTRPTKRVEAMAELRRTR